MHATERSLEQDFSREVLEDLYAYRLKRPLVAWLLWASLGWMGAHRFYLERPFTGLLQLFTGGGALVWWLLDVRRVNRLVRDHNREQAERERTGRPPIEMSAMPPLDEEALRRRLRLAGDVMVLLVAGFGLGAVIGTPGSLEALAAVVLLAVMISLGVGPAWLDDVPGFHALTRWTHRLRVFHFFNEPGSPFAMLLRAFVGVLRAPFRTKDRTEVRLYVELGAGFSALFLLLDVVPAVVFPLVSGNGLPDVEVLASGWIEQVFSTFLLTYMLAAPVGGVLTLYLLTRATHTPPRILAAFTLVSIALGALAGMG